MRSGSRSGRRPGTSDDERHRRPRTSKGDRSKRKRSRSKSQEGKKNSRKHCRSTRSSPDRRKRGETAGGSKYPRDEDREHRRSRSRGSSKPRSRPLASKENQRSSCGENAAAETSHKDWPADKPSKNLARTQTCSDLKQMAESPEGKKLKKNSKLSLNWNTVETESPNGNCPETRIMAWAEVVLEGSLEQNLLLYLLYYFPC